MSRGRIAAVISASLCVIALITAGRRRNLIRKIPGVCRTAAAAWPAITQTPGKSLCIGRAVLTQYAVDIKDATLTPLGSVTLPRNVQYAWPSPDHRVLYVSWSAATTDGTPWRTGITSFRIDRHTGALTRFGTDVLLDKRPVHIATDNAGRYLLAAHNAPPAGVTVWAINRDGSLGGEIPQTGRRWRHLRTSDPVDPWDRMAILTTRGNVPAEAPSGVEEPGAMKVFAYDDGILSNETSVAPNDGFGFQPRHVVFSRLGLLVYLAVERQNQLQVYRRRAPTRWRPCPSSRRTRSRIPSTTTSGSSRRRWSVQFR